MLVIYLWLRRCDSLMPTSLEADPTKHPPPANARKIHGAAFCNYSCCKTSCRMQYFRGCWKTAISWEFRAYSWRQRAILTWHPGLWTTTCTDCVCRIRCIIIISFVEFFRLSASKLWQDLANAYRALLHRLHQELPSLSIFALVDWWGPLTLRFLILWVFGIIRWTSLLPSRLALDLEIGTLGLAAGIQPAWQSYALTGSVASGWG